MLLQAGLLVRLMNSQKPSNSKMFIAVAIYINAQFTAGRYLVYNDSNDVGIISQSWIFPADHVLFLQSPQIKYVRDDFDLSTPLGAFDFFYQLHNLPSALPTNYNNASARFKRLLTLFKNQNLKGHTTRTPQASSDYRFQRICSR